MGGNTQEGGGVTHFALIRVKTDGTQDLAFGNGGAVRSIINGYDFMEDLLVQPDNKIVVAGWSDTNSNDFVVTRYTADGQIDTTFNAGGPSPGTNTVDYGGQERSKALARQADGKIVLVGECADSGGTNRDICAMRFNANGALDTASFGGGTGDFNGDGKPDILWRHYGNGNNLVWLMDGATKVGSVNLPGTGDTDWRAVAVADFDGDGKVDILWRHQTNGSNVIWLMDGTTKVGSVTLPGTGDVNWKVAGAGDFNGDGKADILWRHYGNGLNLVWYMDGTTKTGSAYLPGTGDLDWRVVHVGDYDGDGQSDVVWRHNITGQNVIWLMDGVIQRTKIYPPALADTTWKIAPSDF